VTATVRVTLDLPAHLPLDEGIARTIGRLYFMADGTIRDSDRPVVVTAAGPIHDETVLGHWELRP
jgi:hypothetical protein